MRTSIRKTGLLSTLCAGLLISLLSLGTAQAQGERPFYFGVKMAQMTSDINALDPATNAGVLVGIPLVADRAMSVSLEGEFTSTVSKGDARLSGYNGQWDINTLALYGALRSGGPVYFKAKAGYLSEDVSISRPGVLATGSDSGLSYGLGIGWRLSGGSRLEVEYTLVEKDVNMLSLGFIF